MRRLSIFIISTFISVIASSQGNLETFLDKSDDFFKKYVINQQVDYASLSLKSEDIHSLTTYAGSFTVDKTDTLNFQAYWINMYNLLVIKQVIENYPISSPMEVAGFFDKVKYDVGDNAYTLNEVEHEILYGNFDEPMFHFVLVCGAKGCPPIVNFAYRPEMLNEQMEIQTRAALNDPEFIKVDDANEKVQISEIFKWYPEDFENHSGTSIKYINKYRTKTISESYNVSFYTYNWALNTVEPAGATGASVKEDILNVQTYTPSSLLKKGQFEVQLFNNLYTQTAFRDETGDKVELNTRDNYFTGLFYVLLGTSKSGRINLGFDVNFRSVRIDPDPNSSPLKVLTFEDTEFSRTGISSLGPKIKILPFKSIPNASIQSSLWFNVASDSEGTPWFDHDATTWWTRLFYDRMLGTSFQLFTEVDALVKFSNKSFDDSFVEIPMSVFISYFPTSKSTVYGMLQYTPNVVFEDTYYAQTGIGAKYQIFKHVGLEASYTNFFAGKNNGAGSTFNLGIRYVR